MSFVNPSLDELADSAMEKLRNGAAVSIPDAARKARVARGLKATPAKLHELTVELNRRSRAARAAQKENAKTSKTRSEKVGR